MPFIMLSCGERNYVGSISVGPQMTANDIFRPLGSFVVPIPSNVVVRAKVKRKCDRFGRLIDARTL